MNYHILSNHHGMQVKILDFGARVSSILFPIKGRLTEMTLAYTKQESYLQDPFYLGATVGRVCNRIAKARFSLNHKEYQLSKNSGENCLHGGAQGFSSRYWHFNPDSLSDNFAELSLLSEDGDQGFPGRVLATVVYRLTANNSLEIEFKARTDQDTVVNMCNHCYFHLGEPSIKSLSLQLNALHYLPINREGIPTGEVRVVKNSPFSFKQLSVLGEKLTSVADSQLQQNNGYDHCFVLENTKNKQAVATLVGNANRVKMQVFTDQPGLQLYSGQYLADEFSAYQGMCLEAQNFPNAINTKGFPTAILTADEHYHRHVCYQFSELTL
ncbi:aldose 1-epimerase [Thalassotalea loyana]|uniref:Aldose 1-epimerase n=2 Tax=Thalassotalea loyana TaxID=280483 RepID=A0ABQ6HF09_9GAMM|nr:aldose 1-epimerase [Thalassotalea loyana]